jgi:hypothetical protein
VARISADLFVTFTAPDRLTLGPSWRAVQGSGAAGPMNAVGIVALAIRRPALTEKGMPR